LSEDDSAVYGMIANLHIALEMIAEKLERGGSQEVKRILLVDAKPPSNLGSPAGPLSIEERLTTLHDIVFRLVEEMVEVVESMRPGEGDALRRRALTGS
jgi:hypothetical protein